MFSAIQEITASVFAELPDHLRVGGRTSGWAFGKGAKPLHSFLEGPAFDRHGNLYLVDIPYGRILKLAPDRTWSVVLEYDGWPNGLQFHRDGRLFVADHRRGLLAVDTAEGTITPVLEYVRREAFKGLNDLVFSASGAVYFTDQGQTGLQDPTGRVYRMGMDGRVDCLIDNVPSPNGIVLTSDETSLLVAATRSNEIWRLPLHADGTTTTVSAFIRLSGGLAGPDGLAMDEEGGLAIAHCGLGTVWLFSRLGEPVLRIRCPAGLSTVNVAFGGPDRKTLYIVEADSGTIMTAPMPAAGQRLYGQS